MPDKYGSGSDRYCYPGSDTLVNLLGIRDQDLLTEAEAEFTAERYRTYQSSSDLSLQDFSLSHLKQLHHHLFQDLYSWAGELRDVDISKGDTRFCTWSRIEPEANRLLEQVPGLALCSSKSELVVTVADLFCELNLVHPFREGNGRALRFFFEEMLFAAGYSVTWPNISRESWIQANVAGVNLDLEPLKLIFSQAISEQ